MQFMQKSRREGHRDGRPDGRPDVMCAQIVISNVVTKLSKLNLQLIKTDKYLTTIQY